MMYNTDKTVKKDISMSLSAVYTHTKKAQVVLLVVAKAMPILKKMLKVPEDVKVRIAPIKAKNTNGRYYDGTKLVELDCRLAWDVALEVLCHEMVHAEQYHTGKLEKVFQSKAGWCHKWNGSLNKNRGATYAAYRNQPWEAEAWARQVVLAETVSKVLEGKLTEEEAMALVG